jgi:hypothetical protein
MAIALVSASSPIVSPKPVQIVGLLHATEACPDGSIQPKVVAAWE